MPRAWTSIASTGLLLGGLAVGLVWGHPRSAVDWQRGRAVVLASDDWGLCGFLPDSAAIAHLDREALAPGQIPDAYWHTTLEDSAMVAALGAVLQRHRGRDGLTAVLQPNYIMASLAYVPATADSLPRWIEQALPAVPPGYERPGLWRAVQDLQRAGLWHPELHGRWHYDPRLRQARTAAAPPVQAAAARQILAFPDCDTAWELGSWRDLALIEDELRYNLEQFGALFGGLPRSVIAPDYYWNDAHEQLWIAHGLRVIQGQRQQRQSAWRGWRGRVSKVGHRVWTRWWRSDRVYIDRNCLFEPVLPLPEPAHAARAYREVTGAWARHEPAVVQAHRINFVHLDAAVRRLGLLELERLLSHVTAERPVFLVDGELAALSRRGTSWVVRGDALVVRNLTRARRLVVVPEQALRTLASQRDTAAQGIPQRSLLLTLAPGESRVLHATPLLRRQDQDR